MAMKKYPGLLTTPGDKEEAIYSGLLKMGANMGGYSKTPISLMNRLSRAGQNFGTGYQERIAQSKQDQLGDLEYQKMMGQMEAQQLALGKEKEDQAQAAIIRDARTSFQNMPEASSNTRADGSGATKSKMFERAYPDLVAVQRAKSMYPTASGSRLPGVDIQNYGFLESLEKRFPKVKNKDGKLVDHPQVAQFKSQINVTKMQKYNNRYQPVNQVTGVASGEGSYMGLPPEKTPKNIFQAAEAAKEGGDAAEARGDLLDNAVKAKSGYEETSELLSLLESPDADINTGIFADWKNNILRVKSEFNISPKELKRLEKGQYASSIMGREVFKQISALGIGARGLDTPAEREFLIKVLTGKVTLEKGTLIKMAKYRQETSKNVLDRYQRAEKTGVYDTYLNSIGFKKGWSNYGLTTGGAGNETLGTEVDNLLNRYAPVDG